MSESKPLTIKAFSESSGISVATIMRAIKKGELIAVIKNSANKRGRSEYILDRASANQFKKFWMGHKKR